MDNVGREDLEGLSMTTLESPHLEHKKGSKKVVTSRYNSSHDPVGID